MQPTITTHPSLNHLYDAMVSRQLDDADWSDLPTYGGDAPADTTEVWSWDETHMIVGACADDLGIVSRHPATREGVIAAWQEADERDVVTLSDRTVIGRKMWTSQQGGYWYIGYESDSGVELIRYLFGAEMEEFLHDDRRYYIPALTAWF